MARRISSPIIVGRTEELEALLAAVERGAAGDTETAVVCGEAGVGKSRLVLELGIEASGRGFELVVGGCPALVDSPLPFAPIVAATEAILRTRDEAGVRLLLDGIGPDLVRIAPALAARFDVGDPPAVPEAHIPGRVFDAIRTLLQRAAAEHPLAVVFEDLHWADPASLDLIGYLVRSRGWPGAIVLTYRSDELHRRHPLLPWIAELSRVPSVEVLELRRLGAEEVAVQAEAILGRPPEPALVDELVQRAGGNAFITEELLASLDHAGRMPRSTGVTQVLLARVATLPDDARVVVDAMSVAGVGVDEATVASVIAVPELDVESAFRSALDAQLIVGSGDGYAFRHALLQEAVYDGLLPSERRRYHVAYARSLQAAVVAGRPPGAARLAEVAHHALAADDLPLALQASVSAGRAAASAGAFADASRHLERAVQLVDAIPEGGSLVDGGRAAVLRLAAEAATFSTDPARAVRLWEEAIAAIGPDAAPDVRAELLLGLAFCANDAFRNELALAATREANALLMDEPPSSLRARALADLSRDLSVANDPAAAIEASEASIAVATEAGDLRTEALARGRIALSRAQQGEAGIEDAEAAMRIARTTRDRFVAVSVYFNVGYLFDTLGDPAGAGEILVDEGLPLLAELGLPTVALSAHTGWYLWQAGRWDAGRRVVAAAARDGEVRSGRNLALAMTQELYAAVTVAEAGIGPEPTAVEDAVPWLIAAERAIWDGSPGVAASRSSRGLAAATYAVERGDRSNRGWLLRQQARAQADLALAATRSRGRETRDAAEAAAAAAVERSRELLREGHLSDIHGDDMAMNLVLTEAEATRATGASDPEVWTRAIELWEGRDRVFEPAYARYRRAEAQLAGGGHRAEAADDLRRAMASAIALGAKPLERLISGLAARARIPVDQEATPSAPGDGPGARLPTSLTRRELEVLSLLAEGRSNRQIADTLFISESTAGVHVSNILGKLGVTGRTEAAAVAFRSGLVPGQGELRV